MNHSFKIGLVTSCYRAEKYIENYFQALEKIEYPESIQVLFVHNEPSEKELSIIQKYKPLLKSSFKHIFVENRETIYASWNRAINNTNADYIAIWSIDDYRLPDSLSRQARTLDENPNIGLTYGDHIKITKPGCWNGKILKAPEFNKHDFLRECNEGTFVMWRKEITRIVGFFDEQFKSGGDFEYWVRIAANNIKMKKTEGIIGYFLDEKMGASTDGSRLQPIERTVVELRYAIYDKIDYKYIRKAKKYRINESYYRNEWHQIENLIPFYASFMEERKTLWLKSFVPNCIRIKNRIRKHMRRSFRFLIGRANQDINE